MNYLLDTCMVSETLRRKPSTLVMEWLDSVPAHSLFISVLTLGEIRKGLEQLDEGERRRRLSAWLEIELPAWFEGRILDVDARVCDEWGRLRAKCRKTLPAIDGLLAATALQHRLNVVTRNGADFSGTSVPIVNPWLP